MQRRSIEILPITNLIIQENFILDYFSENDDYLQKNSVNHSLQSFFDLVNDLLKVHDPYKKINKYKLKFKENPTVSSSLRKSISTRNAIFKKYINKKDPHIIEKLHQKEKKIDKLYCYAIEKE